MPQPEVEERWLIKVKNKSTAIFGLIEFLN
jgi:hypothetical protein